MIENLSRTLSRLAAVQILYELDSKDEITNEELDIDPIIKDTQKYYLDLQKKNETTEKLNSKFLKRLVALVLRNLFDIDSMIESNLKKNEENSTKINSLLKEILRSGICEILYFKTPSKVTIDEYAKITKKFFDAEEIGFVNALLDKISKKNLNKIN
jgi:transcription antitermination protein NusB